MSADPTGRKTQGASPVCDCGGNHSALCKDARDVCGPRASSSSGLAALYAFAVSLVVAPHVPYGVAVWAAVWSVVVFRAGGSFARRPVSDRSPAVLPAPNPGVANPAGVHTDGAA